MRAIDVQCPKFREYRVLAKLLASMRNQTQENNGGNQGLDEVKRELGKAKWELSTGNAELDKAKRELDAARTELDEARAGLDKAMQELDKAKRELEVLTSRAEQSENELLEIIKPQNDLDSLRTKTGIPLLLETHRKLLALIKLQREES